MRDGCAWWRPQPGQEAIGRRQIWAMLGGRTLPVCLGRATRGRRRRRARAGCLSGKAGRWNVGFAAPPPAGCRGAPAAVPLSSRRAHSSHLRHTAIPQPSRSHLTAAMCREHAGSASTSPRLRSRAAPCRNTLASSHCPRAVPCVLRAMCAVRQVLCAMCHAPMRARDASCRMRLAACPGAACHMPRAACRMQRATCRALGSGLEWARAPCALPGADRHASRSGSHLGSSRHTHAWCHSCVKAPTCIRVSAGHPVPCNRHRPSRIKDHASPTMDSVCRSWAEQPRPPDPPPPPKSNHVSGCLSRTRAPTAAPCPAPSRPHIWIEAATHTERLAEGQRE